MLTNLYFPGVAGVRVERAWREGPALHLAVGGTRHWARCPLCGRRSKRVHSRYERPPAENSALRRRGRCAPSARAPLCLSDALVPT